LITDDSELLSDNLPFLGGTVMFFVFLGLFALFICQKPPGKSLLVIAWSFASLSLPAAVPFYFACRFRH
jgi:hypothetical protein